MAGAIVGAVGSIAGGILQNRSNNRAIESQERANDRAFNYEQQREGKRRTAHDARVEDYRNAYRQWYEKFGEQGIQRYGYAPGITIGPQGGAPQGDPGGAVPRAEGGPQAPPEGAPGPSQYAASPQGLGQAMGQMPPGGQPMVEGAPQTGYTVPDGFAPPEGNVRRLGAMMGRA